MPRFLLPATIVAALAAFLGGWWLGEALAPAQIVGDIFLRLLRLLVVPLVVTSMVKAVAGLKDFKSLGAFGAKTLAYYLVTMSLAVALGMTLSELIAPGHLIAGAFAQAGPGLTGATNVSGRDFLLAVFPDNLFAALARGDILPLILLSLVFGAALIAVGREAHPVSAWFDALDRVILKLTHWVLFFTPLGVFGLIAGRIAQTGGGEALTRELTGLAAYIATVVAGLLIHGVFVLPALYWIFTRKSPLRFGLGMLEAVTVGFSTASSSATLPVSLECLEKNNGMPERVSRFVLPLGATINMNGTALYEAVAAMFIAQAYGIELTFLQMTLLFVLATVAAIGAAGIPEAGLVTMVIVLRTLHLPLEGIGLLLAVDWFLDRCRTAVNVWDDAVGAGILEKWAPSQAS